jgi:HEAT repeat protein
MSTKSSRGWPFIKGLAKLVSIPADVMAPGSGAALRYLADLQDDLDKRPVETKGGLKEALGEIRANPAEIARQLHTEQITVESSRLSAAAGELAEALYLWQVAKDFLYADFKGIEQQERVASLHLDDIFVDLKAVPEFADSNRVKSRSPGSTRRDDCPPELAPPLPDRDDGEVSFDRIPLRIQKRRRAQYFYDSLEQSIGNEPEIFEELESLKDPRSSPLPLDRILSRSGGTVLLGGPGSGKTTLVKRLARSCALGAEECKRRYPQMPWCFPVILPITTFQTERGERHIYQFIQDYLTALGGEILGDVFREHWAAGQCLILLDGLDELADSSGRTQAARAVDELLLSVGGNRVVVTSRVIGYNVTRLSVPAEHFILEPFSPEEIAKFVRQWYLAHDRALHPDKPDPVQAAKDAESLIQDVQKNPGVGTLATNPLMLTIIALIKHANVVLPERRVELYEIALNTLLRSWNRARSLSRTVPVGEEPKLEKTKKLWAAVAYWMHFNVSRTISEQKLHDQLVRVLKEDFQHPTHEADDIASSYLSVAKDKCGLLEPRGPKTFAFVHQTFQEYLAAIHLAIPARKSVDKIRQHAHDPRWHEAIRLAAGHLAVHQSDFDTLSELMQSLLESDDPLEPYLGTSLRLAMACQSDEIGVRTTDSDRLIERAFQHLTGSAYEPLRKSLLKSLAASQIVPGHNAMGLLCEATNSESTETRMEAARLLVRVHGPRSEILTALQNLLNVDRNPKVQALAAWGLWQAKERRDHDLVRIIVVGLNSDFAGMKIETQLETLPVLLTLLQDEDHNCRISAASVLGRWGYQEQAMPSMLSLLQDEDHLIRVSAASALGRWGHQELVIPILLTLLQDESRFVRIKAVMVLERWGLHEQARTVMLKLLQDADSGLSVIAALMLEDWAPQEEQLQEVLKLLHDHTGQVRLSAARVLVSWGHYKQTVPTLLSLLEDKDRHVRLNALVVMGELEPQACALPALFLLLQDEDRLVRVNAASVLGSWERQERAMPTLLTLLQDTDGYNRYRAAEVLRGWGKNSATVRTIAAKLFRGKADLDSVVEFLVTAAQGGSKQRSEKVNTLLVKGLKRNARDSEEKKLLREILFQWVWNALATTV